jgi:hypothetical protein
MLRFAMSPATAALFQFVVGIGLIISQEQVGGADASPVGAVVADQSAGGDGAYFQLPSYPVGRKYSMFLSGFSSCRDDVPISIAATMPRPYPASSAQFGSRALLIDKGPKPSRIGFPEQACRAASSHGLKDTTR